MKRSFISLSLFCHLSLHQGALATSGLFGFNGFICRSFSLWAFGLAEGCGLHSVLDPGDCREPSLRLPDFPSQMPEPGISIDFLFFQSPALKFSHSLGQGLFIVPFLPFDKIMGIS
jgi:hypothetical protein